MRNRGYVNWDVAALEPGKVWLEQMGGVVAERDMGMRAFDESRC